MSDVVCYTWGNAGVLWTEANWWWSLCSGSIPPSPPTASVFTSIQPPGVDATVLIQPWIIEPWNPYRSGEKEDKKKRIKIVCKVKGQTFEEEKEKDISNHKVSINEIKMIINPIPGIDVDVKKLEE